MDAEERAEYYLLGQNLLTTHSPVQVMSFLTSLPGLTEPDEHA